MRALRVAGHGGGGGGRPVRVGPGRGDSSRAGCGHGSQVRAGCHYIIDAAQGTKVFNQDVLLGVIKSAVPPLSQVLR